MTRRRFGELLAVKQAAQLLGVSRTTIYNWVELGLLEAPREIPGYRWPRFSKANLERLQKKAQAAGKPLHYYMAAQRKRELGITDGRSRRYASTKS